MSDAAQEATEVVSQDESQEHIPGVDPDPELPDFEIYAEEVVAGESQKETEATEEAKAPEQDNTWAARVRKDRQLRQKDIAYKRKEQELIAREQKVTELENVRKSLLDDPNKFLQAQGIDPLDFYADWTNRIASGRNEASPNMRLNTTEKELQALKSELAERDRRASEANAVNQQQQLLGQYYKQIDDFKGSATDKYPLTLEQCSTQDIAEGIGAYYRETGIELGFQDAFQKIEDGLREKEESIFNNPSIIAKFKKFHGLDASRGMGRSRTTLSNNLQTQPTKTPAEDMSDDEIYDFWKGKLFT